MRNSVIDIMKALGIMLVVMFHSLGEVGMWKFISFNMPLFFFLSGWTGLSKNDDDIKILKKLALRLLYVYFIFNILVAISKIFLPSLSNEGKLVGVPEFIWDPFSAPMQISWFLYVLFIIKIINLILRRISDDSSLDYYLAVIVFSIHLLFKNTSSAESVGMQR